MIDPNKPLQLTNGGPCILVYYTDREIAVRRTLSTGREILRVYDLEDGSDIRGAVLHPRLRNAPEVVERFLPLSTKAGYDTEQGARAASSLPLAKVTFKDGTVDSVVLL